MERSRRFSSLGQEMLSVAGFVVAILLLDSGGLYEWAQRLEIGPLRSVAVPATDALHHALQPLMLERVRTRALHSLALVGWSDDPAALAEPPVVEMKGKPAGKVTTVVATSVPGGIATAVPANAKVEAVKVPAMDSALASALPVAFVLPELPLLQPAEVRTVGLAGDSMMAVGLSAVMLQQAPKYPSLRFVKLYRSGTGLARPDAFDWMKEYPAMLGAQKPEVILVAIGANDAQGFVEEKKTYAFGTDGWVRIYQARVVQYLAMLQKDGAMVVWIGLPPMKSGTFDSKIDLVNRITYTVVKQTEGATWWGSRPLVGGTDGAFHDFQTIAGRPVRLRAADGIHLSDDGAALLTAPLLRWLDKHAPVVAPVAAPAVEAPEEKP